MQLLQPGGKVKVQSLATNLLHFAMSLSLVTLAACGNPTNSKSQIQLQNEDEQSTSNSIVGGKPVPEYSALSGSIAGLVIVKQLNAQMANSLRAQGINIPKQNITTAICTGSILSDSIILTAAHCVFDDAGEKTVQIIAIFGGNLIEIAKSKEKMKLLGRPVVGYKISPLYARNKDLPANNGDVAVLRFNGGLPAGFQPAVLAPKLDMIKPTDRVILAGYGITGNKVVTNAQGQPVHDSSGNLQYKPNQANSSGTLRYVTTTILGGVVPSNSTRGGDDVQFVPNTKTTEIGVDQSKGRGACEGDSGGPAYAFVNGKIYLWGITSRGEKSCSSYGIYSNALVYAPWIAKVSRELLGTTNKSVASR